MRKKIATIILFFILAVLQVSFFPAAFLFGISPDLVLVLLVVWLVGESFEKTWLIAISAGFVLDAVSAWPFGVSALSFLLVSVMIDFLRKRFFISLDKKFFVAFIFLILATIINYVCVSFFAGYWPGAEKNYFLEIYEWKNLFLKMFYNFLILAVIYKLAIRSKSALIDSGNVPVIK